MTIKQIADQVGVSKTAIRAKVRRLWPDDQLRREGGTIMLSEEQAAAILADYEGTNTTANIDTNHDGNEVPLLVETLKRHIEILEGQLGTKDTQIAELTAALANATKIQAVQAASLQRLTDGSDRKPWYKRLFSRDET